MENEQVCQHENCNCSASGDTGFCGDSCREAAEGGGDSSDCACGHTSCGF